MNRLAPLNVLEEVRTICAEALVLEGVSVLRFDLFGGIRSRKQTNKQTTNKNRTNLVEAVNVELTDEATEVTVLEELRENRCSKLDRVPNDESHPSMLLAPRDQPLRRRVVDELVQLHDERGNTLLSTAVRPRGRCDSNRARPSLR